MQEFGAPPEVIEAAARNARTAEDFELFEDNEQSVRIFRSLATQWRFRGMDGLRAGLDYSVLPFVMHTLSVKRSDRKQVFEDVMLLEEETLLVQAEKVAKQ